MSVGICRALTAGVLVAGLCHFQAAPALGGDLPSQARGAERSARTSGSPITFRHVIIDPTPPRQPHCKAIGDIDGDGFIDVLAASSSNYTEGLFWYRYPTWERLSIHEGSFTTDMQVGDVDGDGDLDAIIPKGRYKGASVWWYENPRPTPTGNACHGRSSPNHGWPR